MGLFRRNEGRNRMDGNDALTSYTPFLAQYSEIIELGDKVHGQCETRITEVDDETTDDN